MFPDGHTYIKSSVLTYFFFNLSGRCEWEEGRSDWWPHFEKLKGGKSDDMNLIDALWKAKFVGVKGSKGWRWVPGKRHTPMLAVSYYAPWLTSMNHTLSSPPTMTAMLSAESRRKRIIRGGSYLTRKWIMEMIGLLISGRGQTWAHWTMEQDHINLNTPKACKNWFSGSKELVLARGIHSNLFWI